VSLGRHSVFSNPTEWTKYSAALGLHSWWDGKLPEQRNGTEPLASRGRSMPGKFSAASRAAQRPLDHRRPNPVEAQVPLGANVEKVPYHSPWPLSTQTVIGP
jgi:hypothetical protein